ncbi:class I SAM-dependent methyltransferase [Limnospira fusiformis KN01]|uniref:TylF/MycF/NovP-related O-methyltransferase n=1 Tax=Limnospira TaxID=2596745 RepID=UPI001873AD90|nr:MULTISPECIES: TylF/MycF/NovP-related O-methyltransferase [Limnospira]MDT9200120.1 TylF/MycF/NovP-related O-methyltransferase [Limnospira sp. PMC 1042.18]ULB47620.1 class I SAM-dependent methyltransferase [Limnospira fusiformis KN01]
MNYSEESKMSEDRVLGELEKAQELFKQGKFKEAAQLYKELITNHSDLLKSGMGINLAHSIILSVDWSEVSKNLPSGINYLESSGWIKSLATGVPINFDSQPIPWYTYPAIEFIENKISSDFKVFEYGSGQSTLWWAERVLKVISVESDRNWFSYIQEKMPKNVELSLSAQEEEYAAEISRYSNNYFDVIIIDGKNRNKCVELSLSKLKDTGFIIFDNTDDYSYDRGIEFLAFNGYKRIDFYGTIAGYTYKNCTSVFFKDTQLLERGELPSEKESCLGPACFQVTHPRPKNNYTSMDKKWQLNRPVCLILFNRPETTEKVFEAIREVKPPKLFVIADGPRPEKTGEAEKCAAARAIINRVDWDCEVFTNYSTVNLGVRKRISSGLTWLFNNVEEAIVLEDDCLPHPTFFRFCQELLERYRDDERVMFISGDNFQFGQNQTEYSYYFSYYAHCWGWASWRRAWQKYDSEMSLWPQVKNADLLSNILQDNDAQRFWSNIFQQVYEGFNTWDYVWQFTCLVNNGLSILPNANLVSNIGFTSDASHTRDVGSKLANMPTEAMNFPLKHPPFIIRNTKADNFTEKTIFGGKASQQKPQESKEILIEEAVKELNANNNQQALMLFEEAIVSFPDRLYINYGKAVALAKLGQPNQAVGILERLLAVIPDHRKAKLLLQEIRPGKVGDLMQQAVQAINNDEVVLAFNLLNQAKSLKQPTVGLDYLRATCFIKMNQPAAAWQSLYEELRYFPNNTEAQNLRNQIQEQYPQILSSRVGDTEFQELLGLIRPYTMLSEARLYSLFCLTKRVCLENIPGNFAECGVAAGGSTALMAAVIKRYTKQPRWLYAFDSFEGMPSPTAEDKSYGVSAELTGWGTGTCAAPEASTREICSKLGVGNLVQTVKGYFQDTLPIMRNRVGMLALLHMDGDWYESTKAILHNLYDRVSDNGFIQVDDYGHWEGCRQAFHEFESDRQLKFNINPIDGTGVWFQCPNKYPVNPVFQPLLVEEFKEDDPVVYGIQSQMSRNERFQLYYSLRQLLPETSSPLRFIEIGSFAGSSLFLNYRALKRSHTEIQGFAIEPGLHPQLQQVLQQLQNEVTHLRMFSHQAVDQLRQLCEIDGNFPPFIFVDGDHTYEGVRQDIANYFTILAPGGIMVFHDYLPPLNEENREAILFHHGGKEPGIRQACQELMEDEYGCEKIEIPLLYPTDPTQSQAYLPIIPRVFSTVKVYRKPYN